MAKFKTNTSLFCTIAPHYFLLKNVSYLATAIAIVLIVVNLKTISSYIIENIIKYGNKSGQIYNISYLIYRFSGSIYTIYVRL